MKPITNFENLYAVTEDGRIYSYKRKIFLKSGYDKGGYLRVCLYPDLGYGKKGKRKIVSIHRLVAMTFLSNYTEDLEVNHKDGNKTNNCIENLEMVTPKENVSHAYKSGKMENLKIKRAETQILKRKLSKTQIIEIRSLYSFKGKYNILILSQMYGVSPTAIKNIIKRRTYAEI
jgi:hypothetical protein